MTVSLLLDAQSAVKNTMSASASEGHHNLPQEANRWQLVHPRAIQDVNNLQVLNLIRQLTLRRSRHLYPNSGHHNNGL